MKIIFNPGCAKLQMVKAVKETLGIGLKEAKDAVDYGEVDCPEEMQDELKTAITTCGGKLL